jgi:hypothetical protein
VVCQDPGGHEAVLEIVAITVAVSAVEFWFVVPSGGCFGSNDGRRVILDMRLAAKSFFLERSNDRGRWNSFLVHNGQDARQAIRRQQDEKRGRLYVIKS